MLTGILCYVAVATDRATFRTPEVLGEIADLYYTSVLRSRLARTARATSVTRRKLTAAEECARGLITRVVVHDDRLH